MRGALRDRLETWRRQGELLAVEARAEVEEARRLLQQAEQVAADVETGLRRTTIGVVAARRPRHLMPHDATREAPTPSDLPPKMVEPAPMYPPRVAAKH